MGFNPINAPAYVCHVVKAVRHALAHAVWIGVWQSRQAVFTLVTRGRSFDVGVKI